MASNQSHSRVALLRGMVAVAAMAAAFCAATIGMAAGAGPEELTTHGKKLEGRYAGQLEILQAEVEKALPKVDNQKMDAYRKAVEAENAANSRLKRCQDALGKNGSANGVLGHRKGWIAEATGGVAQAKEKLKKAEAMTGAARVEAVNAAQEALKQQQDGYNTAASELKKAQALVAKAELEKPKLTKDVESATQALGRAKERAISAFKDLGLREFLASDQLDAQLAKLQVLAEATPRGLAEYAQRGKDQETQINNLLADHDLMNQMALAGGAIGGKYGQAMQIYHDIRKASNKANRGVLQRLALAVSLQHAVPITQRNPAANTDGPATVNPVNRYLHFEKAYLGGELDPAFKGLSVWEFRMVVNGTEPDEALTWGRKMLNNYRPDHISTKDYRWRYVAAVRTEIMYGFQYRNSQKDKPEIEFNQNILMNGGVCGRRASFGRFMLRTFGIPTIARPSPGHAALAHWTPDGWVICLGGGWGAGRAIDPEKAGRQAVEDVVFLARTQARMTGKPFEQVWRAKTIGKVLAKEDVSGLWNNIAIYHQRAIIEEAKAVALAAVGEDIGEANETREKVDIAKVTITESDRKIVVDGDGVITIPAAACSKPTKSTGKIIFMPSNLGGKQLHYSRTGNPEGFEYTLDVPKAGKYALTARVATPSINQHLTVAVNGSGQPVDIALPYTAGMWDQTQPVEITLAKGRNVLTFSRDHEWLKGLTIRDFTLTPVKREQKSSVEQAERDVPAELPKPDPKAADTTKPVAWWRFNETEGTVVLDAASDHKDALVGHMKFGPGVQGGGLRGDGFTSRVVRKAAHAPLLTNGLTVEAWIAPQEYSWAWSGIVDHHQNQQAGYFLGINHIGQIGFHAAVDGKWMGCTSAQPVPLLKWSHVVGTFDPESGFALHVNGQLVQKQAARGNLTPARNLDLYVGMAQIKQFPALTERKPSMQFLSNMVFDGLIDEVKIFGGTLKADDVKASFKANAPATPQPLEFRAMPSGPAEAKPFGAYYTRLSYCPEWDRIWRTGDHADVLVCFDELPVRMVFWRGTSYAPAWVTENDKWVCDQSPESWNKMGCNEHMSDKRCHYSHVRILENTPARAVVHWRVASVSVDYKFNHVNPDTGWGEWTDEYYYIYPDAVAVRYQEIHSSWAKNMEWQQSELLNQPGTRPQDNIEQEALTLFNMAGESDTWSWRVNYGKRLSDKPRIKGGNIQVMNLKAPQRHFVIGEPGSKWAKLNFGALDGFSTMPCWNHWPVGQLPNDGRVTPAADRPSATCLGTLFPVKHKTDRHEMMIGRNLYGLTGKPAKELVVLARSWNIPAELMVNEGGVRNLGYDKNQRAYVLACTDAGKPASLTCDIQASEESPIVNPAFVIKNWGDDQARLTMDGKPVSEGKAFRYGHRRNLDGVDLIAWIKVESTKPLKLSIVRE